MQLKSINFKQNTLLVQKSSQKQQEVSENNNKKSKSLITPKNALITGAVSLPLIFMAVAIGRDPVKAAKYLKGNINNYGNSAYKKAEKILEQITNNKKITELIEIDLKKLVQDCPKEFLPKDEIFYHGTRHSSKIYRKGFTPFASNQLNVMSREFGAAVYLTPDEKVAQNFKLLAGKIIPVKVNDAKICCVDQEKYNEVFTKISSLVTDEMLEKSDSTYKFFKNMIFNRKQTNALVELMIRKFFLQAGYDGIYVPKGIVSGNSLMKEFILDINKVIGVDQSQLVLFNPEKLEIVSRSFKKRVGDVFKGSKAFLNRNVNVIKEEFKLFRNLMKSMKE
ncbi:MAG: hypothetical protein KHX03_06390 [Clostridium sp.]|nr:hypothetical protein [Clostridium sp.]